MSSDYRGTVDLSWVNSSENSVKSKILQLPSHSGQQNLRKSNSFYGWLLVNGDTEETLEIQKECALMLLEGVSDQLLLDCEKPVCNEDSSPGDSKTGGAENKSKTSENPSQKTCRNIDPKDIYND